MKRAGRDVGGRPPRGSAWAVSLKLARDEFAKALEAMDKLIGEAGVRDKERLGEVVGHAELGVRLAREATR